MLSKSMNIQDIAQECFENAKASGFHDLKQTFVERMMLAVTELSEAVEEYRNGHESTEIYWKEVRKGVNFEIVEKKPEGVPIEIADCIIRLLENCVFYGIDIQTALILKMEFNKTREFRHGGKRL